MTELEMTDEEREYFGDNYANPEAICGGCDETMLELYRQYGQSVVEETTYSEKTETEVCGCCRESDDSHPNGVVIIFKPDENIAEKWIVGEYQDYLYMCEPNYGETIDDLENLDWEYEDSEGICPIQFSYVKSDAWRGRHEAKAENWASLHEDGILSWSSNADKLKTFDILIKRLLWGANVEFAIIIGTTSNLFYQTYEIKTYGEIPGDIKGIMRALKVIYRDPEEYSLTALTGKSGDYTEEDRKFAAYAERLMKGESFKLIMDEILGLEQ